MPPVHETFDPAERARQKQAARDQDERDLAAGLVTRQELQARNSFATGLDLPNAKIVRRKVFR